MHCDLPNPVELERRARIVAYLDALLENESSLRYFDFHVSWGEGERVLSIRSGEGDHAFLWFGAEGALVRGRHGDAQPVSRHVLFAGLPESYHHVRDEPAFEADGDSFAVWWSAGEGGWRWAVDPQREELAGVLAALDGEPSTFVAYAEAYHGQKLDRSALEDLYAGCAVSAAWLAGLGLNVSEKRAFSSAEALGIGVARTPRTRRRIPVVKKSMSKSRTPSPDPQEEDETLGEAEFKVIRVGDETRLVVGGKVQLRAAKAGLYLELLEAVRAALRAAD